jgi:hypothetical protein
MFRNGIQTSYEFRIGNLYLNWVLFYIVIGSRNDEILVN